MKIEEKIQQALESTVSIEGSFSMEKDFIKDLFIDSLSYIAFSIKLEEIFEIELNDSQLLKMKNGNDIVNLLKSLGKV